MTASESDGDPASDASGSAGPETESNSASEESDTSGRGIKGSLYSVAHVVAIVALVVVVVPFVVYAIPGLVGAEQSYVILSGSMQPAIGPGDAIIVESVPPAEVERGDVITFQRPNEPHPTTHRVVEVVEQEGPPAFLTKGDANENVDQSVVEPAQLQGRVMSVDGHLLVLPHIGHVVMFANTPLGRILLIGLPVGLFVVTEMRQILSPSPSSATVETDGAEGHETESTDEDTAVESDRETTAETSGWVVVSPGELRLGIVVCGAFLAYSAWVAYGARTSWSFATAAGVATAFVLLTGLYLTDGSGDDSEKPTATTGRDSSEASEVAATDDPADEDTNTDGEEEADTDDDGTSEDPGAAARDEEEKSEESGERSPDGAAAGSHEPGPDNPRTVQTGPNHGDHGGNDDA